jgi:hypothetical protein
MERIEQSIGGLAADLATLAAHADRLISVGGRACNQDDAADILGFCLKRFQTRTS